MLPISTDDSADLSTGADVNIFLSYAEEDLAIAETVAARLQRDGHEIFNWMDPNRRGRAILSQIESGIRNANAFVVILTPSFLRSRWCQDELGMAVTRQSDILATEPNAAFIHVVCAGRIPPGEAGILGNYDWVDMADSRQRDAKLAELASRFPADNLVAPDTTDLAPPPPAPAEESLFRNREQEVQQVVNGLTNIAGPHYWLVVAPPQLGKTWFLKHISEHRRLSVGWLVRFVDLGTYPADVRGDATALLATMFGVSAGVAADELTGRIAQQIGSSGQSQVCLLDNAELLSGETATGLRDKLEQVRREVQDTGTGLHAALLAASRRDDEWKGITPLRLAALPLTEFNRDVVQQALHDLAAEMGRTFPPEVFRENAARVLRVTEGLPALLAQCLQWIRAEQWVRMNRLATQAQFETFAVPYIQRELLTPACLLPAGQEAPAEALNALAEAYRVLTPYRFFTHSHLRHHLETDAGLRDALTAANWELADLWLAISHTALLRRPLSEPWKEIHGAIRRVLYRYFYRTEEQRAEVHAEARKFVEVWANQQSGTEQVVGMVECLWHEALTASLRDPTAMEQNLTRTARMLSRGLRETAITLTELREFAAERIRDDGELEEAVGNGDGLLSRLAEIVLHPGGSVA